MDIFASDFVPRLALMILLLLIPQSACKRAYAQPGGIEGHLVDSQGTPVAGGDLQLFDSSGRLIRSSRSDSAGDFGMGTVEPGNYLLKAFAATFIPVTVPVSIGHEGPSEITVKFQEIISVTQFVEVIDTAPSILDPDPSRSVIVHDQVLDANPGRPGAPISIPGLPIETASGGIKAPQYFSPGVAGDHGEPIAQYFRIGSFLYPNNLPANAHGNGYADPNFLIPTTIGSADVNGGAFNVRQGNNSVDLAVLYAPRPRVDSFVQLSGDYRDADVMAAWSPRNAQLKTWLAGEFSFGNGYLDRLEHRQQYKLNGLRTFNSRNNEFTIFGIGYYGFSRLPGLIPIDVPVANDTIDDRQLDRTHTVIVVGTDNLNLEDRKLSFSGYYRNYALLLRSNFGDGLIQQSETRNVYGAEPTYIQTFRPWLALLAGMDFRRDAPRNLDLKRVDDAGISQPVTSNNLTLSFVEPFVALDGMIGRLFHYNAGIRQEEVWARNEDLIHPENSFDQLSSLPLPKATLTFLSPEQWRAPIVAFSYGRAFHTDDPRIGKGMGEPTLVSPSSALQLVIMKVIKQAQFNLTLKQVSNSQELAKIDADTGLQEIVGPSLNKVISASIQRNFAQGSVYISYAQADARDTETGEVIPEAPRLIWDAVAAENRLPFHLQVKGEFEYVKAKPLGDGYTGLPVTEIRGAVLRPFLDNRMSLAANFLIAEGYTGQTTETLAMPPGSAPLEQVVGVPLKSFVSMSWTYYFK